MISLPEEYVVSKFYLYAYKPKYNRYNQTYQGGCPVCKEGGSLGKKQRCYYICKTDIIFCHNCGWSSRSYKWIKEVSRKTDAEIIEEVKEYRPDIASVLEEAPEKEKPKNEATLPIDSINLFDTNQTDYYKSNPIVSACLQTIKKRRLDTAVNRPDKLYVSLTDAVHKNRLVIPFVNELGKIEFYQSRTVVPTDNKNKPKYISKIGGEKTLFNVDKIDSDLPCVFVFEGPLNAFFTKKSVAVAGITEKSVQSLTPRQQKQMNSTLKWFEKIWVLDSQWVDNASLSKSEILLKEGETVFIWPENFGKRFKDFNDICIACTVNEISAEFIQKNSFKGLEGIFKLAEIKASRGKLYASK
jgi:hypothetical protein